MKRLLLVLLLLLMAAPAWASSGNRLRLIYIPPPSPLPASQTINFGVKTPVGYGGSPMQYATPVNLGVSRWLAITAQVDKDSNAVTIFCIDDRQMLVPKSASGSTCAPHSGTGAYGGAWSSPAAGPYTVTVAEYRDAAHTDPTGNATVITVPIIANAAHAREMTRVDRGCTQVPCEVTNPDGGLTGTVSTTVNQLNVISTGTALVLGDTVYLRDGYFNPSCVEYRIRPLASYSGSGRITYVSETVDATVANQNGFKFCGAIKIDTTLSGDISLPLDFTHMWCKINALAGVNPCWNMSSTTAGRGLGYYFNRLSTDDGVTPKVEGIVTHGDAVIDHNYVYRMEKALISSGNATVTWNIGEQLPDDFIDIGNCTNYVAFNFTFDWAGKSPNHGDNIQHNAANKSTTCDYGTIEKNIFILGNVAFNQGDPPQGIFSRETGGTRNTYTNAIIQNNFANIQNVNNVFLSGFNNPTIRWEGGIQQLNTGLPLASGSALVVSNGPDLPYGTGLTVTNVAFNTYNYANQIPPQTITNAQTLAANVTAYGIALPNCTQGPNPGWKTRAAVIAACAPADVAVASGGLKNADGTFNWPWFPANDAGDYCWNNGAVFDHTKTCAQMGTTKAQ